MANPQRIVVTGGAGFIGSNFIRFLLASDHNVQIVNLDKLTYAGNLENLTGVEEHPDYRFYRGDITDAQAVEGAFALCEKAFGGPVESVVHFAAESHVDRSIEDPSPFLRTNVLGTQVLLDVARRLSVKRFILVSTDEVYGSLGPDGAFTENMPLIPNSPYSASKGSADLIARAYYQTYDFPVIITRCSNNYGPYQFPEKLIPLIIANACENKPLPVYGNGLNIRDWIYVDDHCAGVLAVLHHGRAGEIYNIGGHAERTNLDVVRTILRVLDKPERLIQFVPDRPGHDRRYAMDTTKIERELGWKPTLTFDQGIELTVSWYLANQGWLERIRTGDYRDYYDRMYANRDAWVRSV